MFISLKEKLDDVEIKDLIEYSVFSDEAHVEAAIRSYRNPHMNVFGIVSEDVLVGLIGYTRSIEGEVTIRHIAVRPDSRGAGFGRGLILEAIEKEKPSVVIAETDEEAVEFYRNIGFEILSLGEKYPGVERYRCTFEVVNEEF